MSNEYGYKEIDRVNPIVGKNCMMNINTSNYKANESHYIKYRRNFNKSSMIKHTINGDLKHELFSLQNPEPSHENSKKRKPKNKRNFIHIQNGSDRIGESKDQVSLSMTKEKERAALLPDTFKPLAQKQYRIIENFESKVSSKFQKLKFKMK